VGPVRSCSGVTAARPRRRPSRHRVRAGPPSVARNETPGPAPTPRRCCSSTDRIIRRQ
jgi:hypothetical protein